MQNITIENIAANDLTETQYINIMGVLMNSPVGQKYQKMFNLESQAVPEIDDKLQCLIEVPLGLRVKIYEQLLPIAFMNQYRGGVIHSYVIVAGGIKLAHELEGYQGLHWQSES